MAKSIQMEIVKGVSANQHIELYNGSNPVLVVWTAPYEAERSRSAGMNLP